MRDQVAPDRAVAAIADAQGGAVSRAQLLALGLTPAAIGRRVDAGRLHLVHRGVYAVGRRRLALDGQWWAGVLACGEDAVLSHWSAAGAGGLCAPLAGIVEVTVGRAGRRQRPGLRVHRSGTLRPEEITTREGLPLTTPGRTILDLAAAGVRGRPLEKLLDEAERLELDFSDAFAVLERSRRPGTGAVRSMLAAYVPGSTFTRSALEERFLALCDRHGISRPAVNTLVEGLEVDFAWREAGLVVEVDGYDAHGRRRAFEVDRERDVRMVLAGHRVLRFTWRHVTQHPERVAAALRAALGSTSSRYPS